MMGLCAIGRERHHAAAPRAKADFRARSHADEMGVAASFNPPAPKTINPTAAAQERRSPVSMEMPEIAWGSGPERSAVIAFALIALAPIALATASIVQSG